MALRTPPSWLQNGSHPAENDRLTNAALYTTTGIIGATSFAVTAQGTPNMTVNVASGHAAVVSSTANAGTYVVYNDATVISTITTADVSLPRIDRVVVTVNDSAYSGALDNVVLTVVAGTPAASPAAPATPNNSISLATIAVAAGATSITAGNITDTRTAITSRAFVPITGGTMTGALAGTSATFSGAVSGSTVAGNVIPTAGSTSVAPIKLTSGTNLTSVQAGAVEYNGSVEYFTPSATSGRAVTQNSYVYVPSAAQTLNNVTTAQPLFSSLTAGISLPNGAYTFKVFAAVASGATAHNTQFTHLGTAIMLTTNISTSAQGSAAAPYQTYFSVGGGVATNLFAGTSTATTTILSIEGLISVATPGTWNPGIVFSAAPGGTNQVNARGFVLITPVGATVAGATTGAWS
jgi:hypothetical protein